MNNSKKIIVAIDGFSSTGKSTVAKALANKLGYIYIDTGAMYRAVTWYAMEQGLLSNEYFDIQGLIERLKTLHMEFVRDPKTGQLNMYLNGRNIETEIRSPQVSGFVSLVAAVPQVRRYLVQQQREMGKEKAVVMDGRDIGSVVFPEAEVKFFLTADPEVRAHRRWLEMKEKGITISPDEILENVQERDRIDSTREDSPLVQTKDAILIDVSHINREEQFEIMYQYIRDKIESL
jgi:cytidylate kinase